MRPTSPAVSTSVGDRYSRIAKTGALPRVWKQKRNCWLALFTEGIDTADLKDARALLVELNYLRKMPARITALGQNQRSAAPGR